MLAVSSSLTSDVLTRSLCKFLLVEPIFCGLWLCWSKFCWFDCCFRLGFHFIMFLLEEFVDIIFPSFSRSSNRSVGPFSWAQFWVPFSSLFSAIFHSVMLRFSVPISISFLCVSCSSIESLRILSFPLHLQYFFLCIQSSLLLQSQLYQSHRRHRLQMKLHCPRHCESLCSDRLRFHHLCYTFHWCQFLHFLLWTQYLVSQSFCISCLFGWWVVASCVASIESFFRVLFWVPKFPLRGEQSEILWRRKAVDGVWACSFSMSTLVCIYGMSPMQPWYGSWFLSFLVGRTRFSDLNTSRFHFLSIFRYSCRQLQDAFLYPSWWCSGYWESSSCLDGSWAPLFQ